VTGAARTIPKSESNKRRTRVPMVAVFFLARGPTRGGPPGKLLCGRLRLCCSPMCHHPRPACSIGRRSRRFPSPREQARHTGEFSLVVSHQRAWRGPGRCPHLHVMRPRWECLVSQDHAPTKAGGIATESSNGRWRRAGAGPTVAHSPRFGGCANTRRQLGHHNRTNPDFRWLS